MNSFRLQIYSKLWIALLWCLVPATAWAQFAPDPAPVPAELRTGFDSITAAQAEQWLNVLASPAFEGRGTGQPGYAKAAHWVAGKIAEFGLQPIGNDGTFFQMVPMQRRTLIVDDCRVIGPDGYQLPVAGNLGFDRFTDKQETTGEVVLVNFSDPKQTLPKDLSLREKIVIYVAADNVTSAAIQVAQKRPLAAIRVIQGQPRTISHVSRPGRRRNTSISGTITASAAKEMTEKLGADAAWIAPRPAPEATLVQSLNKSLTLRLRHRVEKFVVPNVVGWLEGSDPELKNEYIVIGSHLDHLGIRGGQVYPGADDNGSGSTAVLSIARAMSLNSVRPKRSVLFLWFAAEELGLVGSKHFTSNPTKSTKQMICMLNIDMVGRNEETRNETAAENEGHIHLVGSRKGDTDLHQLIFQANESIGFEFEFDEEERVFARSDQINFYRLGVPVAFLFGGFHPDYHQPTDKPKKINFNKIAAAAKLYYLAIHLASEHGRFDLQPSSP